MKRSMSENNSDGEDNMNDGANNLSSGGGSNASGNYSNNNNNRGQKRSRNEEMIRLLIPSRFAGGIIGKGGQNIKRLRQEFHANINVEDCPGPERTVNISAPELSNALKVIEDILHNFGEEDSEIDLRLLIHQSLAGCVIGKGGGKIKEIRDKVGCRILKVFSSMCPQSSDRVVQCIGKAKECIDAISDILVLIKEVPIKGTIQNYDPMNYDDYLADKYGGFGGDNAGNRGNNNNNNNNRGGSGGGGGGGGSQGRNQRDRSFERRDNNNRNFNRRNDGGGRGGGNGNGGGGVGNNNMRDRERNNFINPWASSPSMGNSSFDGPNFNQFGNNGGMGGFNNFNNPNTGSPSSLMNGFNGIGNNPNMGNNNNAFDNNMGNNGPVFGLNSSLGGGNMGNNMPNNIGNNGQNDEGRETTQVTIPKDLAGAIIGKAGTRIRRIRMESNAFITIDEPAQGSTDRIITISGTARQIQLAQYLLQQSVREHRRN
ncbi:heterogeneous nuclear ribonucleoprotein K homolog isoform X2 [Sitodiplosis mosellana]|uniref:heterogeneous nuclear ribonucleoprotein K homolog isoform X2 n=1 Tax=Sitodiplosis mosellana TaxID=263140 RepID=UPI002443D358|nr:heterogeneous nuclear ribonucleoprotein K homolog isoform X2 [Sitodiplosis mosellana]XP_055320983.1 heterogeneous nuclear ribonucleoprotein K homolog isoform X2 [Sitodiplosis mosellana]XP_055320984.1 heterogeneous nuclear ribonucleoprotein K homolog isoform X2 [Sitodiplosis mosellana]XP_055320985.1 heterogeneous nuclear ribonucleoprotein K homolog isoform X2 [Sitodiplosis mosellana]XP_055320986.1 heterogeneous nuclear ribonucleoprotein K homolog isoform X2 [Sitodiplosis mosellana]XP_0553209